MTAMTLFDPVRQRMVPATPEEAVRQAVLRYLMETLGVPLRLIGVEFSLASLERGNFRRMDIVAWRPGPGQLVPWLLVECKAPTVAINDDTAHQAASYLAKAPCDYVMLTNGQDTRYLQKGETGYRLVSALPYFPKL